MDKEGIQWEYIAWDVPSEYFGDVLGELNRTEWQVTGSEELDEQSQPVPGAGDGGVTYQRIHARRRITRDWSWERTRQRWS